MTQIFLLTILNNLFMNLLFIDALFSDMNFVLKIFVLMTIVSYVTQHLGKGPIALIVIAVLAWMIFTNFLIFGSIYVIYMLVLFGITQILMDFFILAPQAAMEQSMGGGVENQPSGADFADRQRKMMNLRQRMRM